MSRFWRASMSSQATDFVALLKRRIVERTFDGSVDVDEWPRSGNALSHKALAFPGSPTVIPCCENDVITQDVLGMFSGKLFGKWEDRTTATLSSLGLVLIPSYRGVNLMSSPTTARCSPAASQKMTTEAIET
jgi:hypothetical protein